MKGWQVAGSNLRLRCLLLIGKATILIQALHSFVDTDAWFDVLF